MQNVVKLMVLFLLVSSSIKAEESKLRISASLVGMSMDYREYSSNGAILDSEESSINDLVGVDIGVSYLLSRSSNISTKLETNLMILGGDTVYKGSILGSGNPYGSVVSTTVNNIIDFDVVVKRNHKLNSNFDFYYAAGLGYRYWERALSASQIEDYEWYSLRTKLGLDYKVTNKLKVGAEFEYQYSFNETMYASNLGSTFDLGGADIMKVSIPLSYSFTDKINIIAQATYEKQTIDHSNVVGGYYEPDSTAKNKYLKIGIDFKF